MFDIIDMRNSEGLRVNLAGLKRLSPFFLSTDNNKTVRKEYVLSYHLPGTEFWSKYSHVTESWAHQILLVSLTTDIFGYPKSLAPGFL